MKQTNLKVVVHVKKQPRRNDSMFYYGKHIATVVKGRRTVVIESAGEMEASFTEEGKIYEGSALARQLNKRKVTDKGLSKIGSNDMIRMNNWFRVFFDNDPTNTVEEVAHTYDDAIALAKNRMENE